MRGQQLQVLKHQIRKLEAGGARNIQLRREYNAKLRSHRYATHKYKLHGGGNACPLQWPVTKEIGEVVQQMVKKYLFDFKYETTTYTNILDVWRLKSGLKTRLNIPLLSKYESIRKFSNLSPGTLQQLNTQKIDFDLDKDHLLFLRYEGGKIILDKVKVIDDKKPDIKNLLGTYAGNSSTFRLHNRIKETAHKVGGGGGFLVEFVMFVLAVLLIVGLSCASAEKCTWH